MNIVRLQLHSHGLVDEVVLNECSVEIQRTGMARYQLTAVGASDEVVLEIWTSKTGRIDVQIEDAKDWLMAARDSDGTLEHLAMNDCLFHLEQMDRGLYWIGLTRGDTFIHVRLSTGGYIKTKVVRSTLEPPNEPLQLAPSPRGRS